VFWSGLVCDLGRLHKPILLTALCCPLQTWATTTCAWHLRGHLVQRITDAIKPTRNNAPRLRLENSQRCDAALGREGRCCRGTPWASVRGEPATSTPSTERRGEAEHIVVAIPAHVLDLSSSSFIAAPGADFSRLQFTLLRFTLQTSLHHACHIHLRRVPGTFFASTKDCRCNRLWNNILRGSVG
jgi:hypothetical protein